MGIGLRSTKPLSLPTNRGIWKRDPRMSLYCNLKNGSEVTVTPTGDALRLLLSRVENAPVLLDSEANIAFLCREIGLRLFSFLLKPKEELDIKLSLAAVGVGSLIDIGMQNWWEHSWALM